VAFLQVQASLPPLKVAREMGKGKTIITILPNSADRYFSMEEYVR